jgi:hypothetical protein
MTFKVKDGIRIVDNTITSSGTDLLLNGSKIWTQGNDGETSGLNADVLDGIEGTDYTRKDLTGLGNTGYVAFDSVTNTEQEWSDLPVGYSSMMANSIGTAGGAPLNNYGYFTKIANRDNYGGWAGLWGGYYKGQNYIGRSSTDTTFATWEKLYSDDYHPTADKLTTSRSISLSGDATGSVSFDGTSDVTLPVVINSDVKAALFREATLNLDFANNNYEIYEGPVDGLTSMPFSDAVAFTRSSGATANNATGGINDVLVDEQRLVGNREGLLLEEQRTNIALHSEDLTQAVYTKRNTSVTGSDNGRRQGSLSVVIEDTANSSHDITQDMSLQAGDMYTVSFVCRLTAARDLAWYITNAGTASVSTPITVKRDGTVSGNLDLITGVETKVISDGLVHVKITTKSIPEDCDARAYFRMSNDGATSYTGDGESEMSLGELQVERGSFATSYVPTTTTQVTRAAEDCRRVVELEANRYEGTVYQECVVTNSGMGGYNNFTCLLGTYFPLGVIFSPTELAFFTGSTVTMYPRDSPVGENLRIAFCYENTSYTLVVNGVVIATASGNWSDNDYLANEFGSTSPKNPPYPAQIKNRKYIPRALSVEELKIITTQEV